MNAEIREAIHTELRRLHPESRGPGARDIADRGPWRRSQVWAELEAMRAEGLVHGRKIHGVIRWNYTDKGREAQEGK